MFEKFGEFDSYAEINKAAEGLKAEGDIESLKILAKENGIDEEDVEDYVDGTIDSLTTQASAALGKIIVESEALGITAGKGILEDWKGYILAETMGKDGEEWSVAIRKKGKSFAGCLKELVRFSAEHQYTIPEEVTSGIKDLGGAKVTSGTPSMAEARMIIREYYLGGGRK